jgi:hypothetical protein
MFVEVEPALASSRLGVLQCPSVTGGIIVDGSSSHKLSLHEAREKLPQPANFPFVSHAWNAPALIHSNLRTWVHLRWCCIFNFLILYVRKCYCCEHHNTNYDSPGDYREILLLSRAKKACLTITHNPMRFPPAPSTKIDPGMGQSSVDQAIPKKRMRV